MCIAVKEDRHQNIMSSVVLKKGIEEPWAGERVARFINSLGYKEITLKSDTEQAIIAFRNRATEKCRCHAGACGQRRQASSRLVENAVMLLRGVIRNIKCHVEAARKKNTEKTHQSCRGWCNMR